MPLVNIRKPVNQLRGLKEVLLLQKKKLNKGNNKTKKRLDLQTIKMKKDPKEASQNLAQVL